MYGSISFDVYAHENIIMIKIMNTFADLPKLPCVRGYLRKQIVRESPSEDVSFGQRPE